MNMTFFKLICCKNCLVCLKRPKMNEKEAGVGPYFLKKIRRLRLKKPCLFFQFLKDSSSSSVLLIFILNKVILAATNWVRNGIEISHRKMQVRPLQIGDWTRGLRLRSALKTHCAREHSLQEEVRLMFDGINSLLEYEPVKLKTSYQ